MEVCVFFVILLMMPFIKSLPPLHPEKKKITTEKHTQRNQCFTEFVHLFLFCYRASAILLVEFRCFGNRRGLSKYQVRTPGTGLGCFTTCWS